MEKPPAFQFYAGDFLSNDHVCLMTNEQIGAYVLLLCHQWQRPEGLPASLSSLAKLARCTTARFERNIWPAISACFEAGENGHWFNSRLEKERTAQMTFRERCSVAGKASAAQRQGNQPARSVQPALPSGSNGTGKVGATLQSSVFSTPPVVPQDSELSDLEAIAAFLDGYRERYRRVVGGSLPLVNSHKDMGLAAQLLKTWPADRLLDMAEIFFHRNDAQVAGKPKTLPFFVPLAPWCDSQLVGAGR